MASPVASHFVHRYNFWQQSRFLIVLACSIQLAACSSSKYISKQSSQLILSDSNFTAAHVGISIYDPSSNKYLYEHQSEKYFIPASNTKLLTCYAAMKHLGDSLVGLRYSEEYSKGDTSITIYGTGDPTFLHPDFKNNPVFEFLKSIKLKKIFLTKEDDNFKPLGFGWSWDDYLSDYMVEKSFFPMYGNTANFFITNDTVDIYPKYFKSLSDYSNPEKKYIGIRVIRGRDSNNFYVTSGNQKKITIPFYTGHGFPSLPAKLLSDTLNNLNIKSAVSGTPKWMYNKNLPFIYSQPTDSLLKPMMHRSDNFFAEQTLLMVSNEMTGVMNDAKIIDSLLKTDLKDLPQKPRWVDGSGLSRYNLFSPNDMVAVLSKMKNEFHWNRITTILPTGGEGTLSSYYLNLKDRIFAKTGTLSNNIALSGFLITRQNKTLIFSVLVNNHMGNTTQIRKAVEKFLTSIADRY